MDWFDLDSKERSALARTVVRSMLSEDDPFCAHFGYSAFIPLCILHEAWSPERREEIRRHGLELGYTLVEHAVIGDYDMTLWHSDKTEPPYLVGLNSAQHDPLDPEVQRTPQLAGRDLGIKTVQTVLRGWLREYGVLVVGSVMPERNARYLRLVRRMFPHAKLEPWYSEDFRYGFKLHPEDA